MLYFVLNIVISEKAEALIYVTTYVISLLLSHWLVTLWLFLNFNGIKCERKRDHNHNRQ